MTRFEEFKENAQRDLAAHKGRMQGNGTFDYVKQAGELQKLSNKMCAPMMIYLFGEDLGLHLMDKYVNECRRNLLYFLSRLTSEYSFFILHELKTNPSLLHFG